MTYDEIPFAEGVTLPPPLTLPERAALQPDNRINSQGGSAQFARDDEWSLPRLEPAAMHGVAGSWAEAVKPYTEGHPAGILGAFLVAAGNAIGGGPYLQVGPTRHRVNENVALVRPTAAGRKGDATRVGMRPVKRAAGEWADERIHSGFGSGEAVIRLLQDAGDDTPGASSDRRLCIRESELAGPLAVASRDGSTLSVTMRNAWDGTLLENVTKASTIRASDHHVSVIASITPDELRRRLTATDQGNGFANRFLFVAVKRLQLLPDPPPLPDDLTAEVAKHLEAVFSHARKTRRVQRDEEVREAWNTAYRTELSVDRPGLVGACTSRAEAHAARLSLLYALLDGRDAIEIAHHEAALAFWRYCEASAQLIWGDSLGDPVADTILDALRERHDVTRNELRDLFGRHRRADELDQALTRLHSLGLITIDTRPTAGRSVTLYSLRAESAESAERYPG